MTMMRQAEDYRQQVASGALGEISIGKLSAFAQSRPEWLKTIPVTKVAHDVSWWDGDEERMLKADTKFPILVLVMPDGEWTVTDGLNRLKKAVSIEKKKTIQAYVIPTGEIPPEVFMK